MYIPKLSDTNYIFPDTKNATEDGLVAWGDDLNIERIISAYRSGIFPWYNEYEDDPVLWWSPNPRLILHFDDLKVSKSLQKSIRKFQVKFDTNFEAVMKNCRDVRIDKEGSWIGDDILDKYIQLHKMGIAHSVETYYNDELVGGLYGVSVGSIFCGESMFSRKSDASKVALYHLVEKAKELNYNFIDCQIPTNHLKSMGAIEVSRDFFIKELKKSLDKTPLSEW